jgi:hypothetical protein
MTHRSVLAPARFVVDAPLLVRQHPAGLEMEREVDEPNVTASPFDRGHRGPHARVVAAEAPAFAIVRPTPGTLHPVDLLPPLVCHPGGPRVAGVQSVVNTQDD